MAEQFFFFGKRLFLDVETFPNFVEQVCRSPKPAWQAREKYIGRGKKNGARGREKRGPEKREGATRATQSSTDRKGLRTR